MMAKNEPEALGFSDALAELETILERIDSEEVDIDELAAELRRAAELLELCREKIRAADLEVTQIVQRLEEAAVPEPESPDDEKDGEEDDDNGGEGADDEIPF
jgi:exodeoxyribonuclease VII small subunit